MATRCCFDEAERVFQRDGLEAFTKHETARVDTPLPPGPFKPLLEALHRLQTAGTPYELRTALVTARSAPAHERAVRTLGRTGRSRWTRPSSSAAWTRGSSSRPSSPISTSTTSAATSNRRGRHVATGHVPFGIAGRKPA